MYFFIGNSSYVISYRNIIGIVFFVMLFGKSDYKMLMCIFLDSLFLEINL